MIAARCLLEEREWALEQAQVDLQKHEEKPASAQRRARPRQLSNMAEQRIQLGAKFDEALADLVEVANGIIELQQEMYRLIRPTEENLPHNIAVVVRIDSAIANSDLAKIMPGLSDRFGAVDPRAGKSFGEQEQEAMATLVLAEPKDDEEVAADDPVLIISRRG
jgi:hypothetical protein